MSGGVSSCEVIPLEFFGKFRCSYRKHKKLFNNNNNSTEAGLFRKSQGRNGLIRKQNIFLTYPNCEWHAQTEQWRSHTVRHCSAVYGINGEYDKLFFQSNLIPRPRTSCSCNITSTKHQLTALTTVLLQRQTTATISKPNMRTKHPWVWHKRKTGSVSSSACYTLNRNRVFCIPRGS